MNRAQKIVVLAYCLAVAYACFWVPWQYSAGDLKNVYGGYAFLWDGPQNGLGTPDGTAVAAEVVALTALGLGLFLLAQRWKHLLVATGIVMLAWAAVSLNNFLKQMSAAPSEQAHQTVAPPQSQALDPRFEVVDPDFEIVDPPPKKK